MTDREKAVVMAYTGVVMLTGDKLNVFYGYVSEIIGRPVHTHELPALLSTIKEAAFPDFCVICKTEETEKKTGNWIHNHPESRFWFCSECSNMPEATGRSRIPYKFCPHCGTKMLSCKERE